jgi:hypothetical protein
MAYLIGLVTPAEADVLEMRGWELEDPPAPDYFFVEDQEDVPDKDKLRYVMIWVDSNLFDIMSEATWTTGCGMCGAEEPESNREKNQTPRVSGNWHKKNCKLYKGE